MRARIACLMFALVMTVATVACQQPDLPPPIKPQPQTTPVPGSRFARFDELPVAASEPDPDGMTLLGVGIAVDGAYLKVDIELPLSKVALLTQDYIWVVDEQTRVVYKDIPVMPKIGPLIGRPAHEGQGAYVMLLSYGTVKPGAIVTVVVGNYKREHIKIGEGGAMGTPVASPGPTP